MTIQAPQRLEPAFVPPDPLEICSGMIFGTRRSPVAAAAPQAPVPSPREALEALLLPALSRPPCLVAFSGGRDSSAMLAAATDVARRHGLEEPVPVTMRFEELPRTDEAEWQETTLRHLGLREWQRLSLTTELDALGEFATGVLRRHGLYWPPNAHSIVPLLRAAEDGALVTGNGGDEVLSPWGWRSVALLRAAKLRPTAWDLKHVLLTLLPDRLCATLWRARRPLRLPWLTPEGQRQVTRLWGEQQVMRSRTWGDELETLLAGRYLELAEGIFGSIARDAGVHLIQPFLHPDFVRATVAAAPWHGHPSRSAALEAHFGDLLPAELISRSTKASFTEILWGPEARAFAEAWDGSGLPDELVNKDELRQVWARPCPDFRSVTALQAAWLATQG